jgi:hypothetical protein
LEIVIVGNKNTDWYKRCRQHRDNKNADGSKVRQFCEENNIAKEDFMFTPSTLYVKAVDKYKLFAKQAKTNLYYVENDKYYIIKKNSSLGRKYSKLELTNTHSPMVGFELFDGIRCRSCQFLHNNKIYVRIESETKIEVPNGFKEMKMADYFSLTDKIKDPTNKLSLENV